MGHRGFRVRWWMWLAMIALLLACIVIVLRIAGLARLDEEADRLRAMGLPVTAVELIARAPAVDADRQRRLRSALEAIGRWSDDIHRARPTDALAIQRPQPAEIAARDRALAAGAADMAALTAILAEGPCELSVFGWCERDPARLAELSVEDTVTWFVPNLLNTRNAMHWLSARAALDEDPESHLLAMDRLVASYRRPGVLIDAMIGMALASGRDETHLWLATRGRLPPERLLAWAQEPPPHRTGMADGYAGERCLFHDPMRRWLWDMAAVIGTSSGSWETAWSTVHGWPMQGYIIAHAMTTTAAVESRLRGGPPITPAPAPPGGGWAQLLVSNLEHCLPMAVEADNRHRLLRCVALVAQGYRRGDGLPAVLPATAPAAAIDADLPGLRYELLSPSRFRVGIDPHGPLPPAIPASSWTSATVSRIGQPAAGAAVVSRRWSVEIDLDAILVPPPEPKAKPRTP